MEIAVERVRELWDKKLQCFRLSVLNSILLRFHQLYTDRPISKEITPAIRDPMSDLLSSNLRKFASVLDSKVQCKWGVLGSLVYIFRTWAL
jgi:hypothetical protein